MYEAIVLKKEEPRKFAGTRAGRTFLIISFIKMSIISGGLFLTCDLFIRKKKLIDEFNESSSKKPNLYEEYLETKQFWDTPVFNNIVNMVLDKYSKKSVKD